MAAKTRQGWTSPRRLSKKSREETECRFAPSENIPVLSSLYTFSSWRKKKGLLPEIEAAMLSHPGPGQFTAGRSPELNDFQDII